MISPSDSAARSEAGELPTAEKTDAVDNDFIVDLAIRTCNTPKGSEETKRLKRADEKLPSTAEKHQENSAEDDDDAWETDMFKEFDGLMKKHDYFDTNSYIPLGEEVFNLLDRPFNEKGDPRRTVVNEDTMLVPVFLSQHRYIEESAKIAVEFYNRKKDKQLKFVKVCKALYCHEYEGSILSSGYLYFITLMAIDDCIHEDKTILTNVFHSQDGTMHVRAFKLKSHH